VSVIYRLVRAGRVGDAFSGEAARRYGGRWNPRGTAVVYASESRALAVLEVLVHLTLEARTIRFALYTITLPGRARIQRHRARRPPSALASSQQIGRAWADEARSLALVVPSAVVPQEMNYVLNVRHSQFAQLAISAPEPFSFDERLWRQRFA
jgi:RES domain-containing protein